MQTKYFVLGISALALVLGLSLHFWQRPDPQHQIDGLLWPQRKVLQDFTLVDENQQQFNLASLNGQWTLLFFGYTHCPDICPMTLSLLKQVKQRLLETAPEATVNTQYVFVSVDGKRDTPEVLAGYTDYFDPEFFGVSGTPQQVEKLTRQLGIVYFESPNPFSDDPNDYLVEHSSSILLINPQGEMIAIFSTPHTIEKIADNYTAMRQFLAQQS